MIVEETNDIGTVYLRRDLLPAGVRQLLQEDFGAMWYPRLGLIRVDAFDQALVELRESMK